MGRKSKRNPETASGNLPAPVVKRSRKDQALVNKWGDSRANPDLPLLTTRSSDDGNSAVLVFQRHEDPELQMAKLCRLMGVRDGETASLLLTQATNTLWGGSQAEAITYVLPLLQEIAPADGMEGMLAVQMVAVHNAATEQLRRANIPNQTVEGLDAAINRATKLLRLYATQMECLDARRGKSKVSRQKVSVKHVHVHEGGQAIVGAVAHGKPNGRG